MVVLLQNLSIEVIPKTSKSSRNLVLLQPITTTIGTGKLFAILGGSGSGKTTLLNVIAGRFDKKSYIIKGEVLYDGSSSCAGGYVTQQDYLLPFLTVHETLMFAAKMSISENSSVLKSKRKYQLLNISERTHEMIVDDVILDLGLKECAHNLIGDDILVTGKRGISGGEKRRVSIAIQILSNPTGFFV
jgi:ABC-type multidrug transport system ATPase subunit